LLLLILCLLCSPIIGLYSSSMPLLELSLPR
jgi:hypothetical protein